MSKADEYPYPEDEFDVPADPDAPRGVHRAPRSAWSRWWPFVAVLVLAPVLAYGAVTVWGMLNEPGTSDPGASTADEVPGDTTDDGATDDGTGEQPAEGEGTPTEPDAAPAPQPVLSTPVVVLNAAGIAGLAGQQQEKLTGAGFTAVTTGNSEGEGLTGSTVFYASEDLKATADLVGQTLGIAAVTLSADDAPGGISVVLLTDPEA